MEDKYYNTEIDDEVGEVLRAGCISVVVFIAAILLTLGTITLLVGCTTTKYVTVPETHIDTVLINHQLRDSIYLKDSIYVSEKQNGDTILLTTIKWSTRYIDRWRTDTLYKSKIDSVPKPVPVEIEVEKELSTWQKFRMTVGDSALVALLLLLGFGIWKAKKLVKP